MGVADGVSHQDILQPHVLVQIVLASVLVMSLTYWGTDWRRGWICCPWTVSVGVDYPPHTMIVSLSSDLKVSSSRAYCCGRLQSPTPQRYLKDFTQNWSIVDTVDQAVLVAYMYDHRLDSGGLSFAFILCRPDCILRWAFCLQFPD